MRNPDTRQVTIDIAEAAIGRRLDRRKKYAIVKGQVCGIVTWSQCCSGCCEHLENESLPDGHGGGGCSECGYTGRRRRSYWVPV